MAEGEWHYALGDQQHGPVTLEALHDLICSGTVTRNDRVWRPGMNQWLPAGDLAVLANSFLGGTPPPMPMPIPLPAPAAFPPPHGMLQYQTPVSYYQSAPYAGFWRRAGAYILDIIILNFVPALAFAGAYLFFQLLNNIIFWLYFALMESSQLQATVGKLALGIQVTDMDGQRVGFGKATGRYFGKILSGLILCIGFMMAGWTERKQALHDFMANTLVVCKA